jgi:hypothetical protein
MTKQFSYIQMLEEVMDKQNLLSVKLVELQSQQLMLTSKLIFTFDKKQRKAMIDDSKKLDKQIKALTKTLTKINKLSDKLQKVM